MPFSHKSGILLHITSLPDSFGIGDQGPAAYRWLRFLKSARTRYWQVLPLGPTGYGDSPYQSYSSFAGNHLLISPQLLAEDGLIDQQHLDDAPKFAPGKVDYRTVTDWKRGLFQVAFLRQSELPHIHKAFQEFRDQQKDWLDDYSLFMTLKAQNEHRAWLEWPAPLRDREPAAIQQANKDFAATKAFFAFEQFLFFEQWRALRQFAHEQGIQLIGDLPIYVAHDSADVWCNRDLFELDDHGERQRVAGVPPDMFSATGQLWGNPLYRWDVHKDRGFSWWLARLRAVLDMVDVLRLDHFRGFADYYAIPGDDLTAENGIWELGPGAAFFEAVQKEFRGLPIIAEDLGGERSQLVLGLRDHFELPGMKVLQFAFDEDMNHRFLPHNYPENCVAYTGTHDNDTSLGWYHHALDSEREFALQYLKSDGENFSWDMLRALWDSRADLTVAPIQDFLELGSEARMNFPGRALGNWDWRLLEDQLTQDLAARIAALNKEFDRAT